MSAPRKSGRAKTGRGDPRAGFLMAEAMAALVLGALILVGLLSLSGILRRSADRAAWSVEVSEVSRRTVDTMAREFRRAARLRWAPQPLAPGANRVGGRPAQASQRTGASASPAVMAQRLNARPAGAGEDASEEDIAPPRPFVFSGAPDRLTFALMPRDGTGLRSPVFVAWQIEEGGAVLRAEAPLPPDATRPGAIQLGPVERIDPGPERLRFAYVLRQGGVDTDVDSWSDPLRMPAAIRIDRFDAASGVQKGSLRVPILVDAEAGCASDKDSKRCSRVEGGSATEGGAGRQGAAPASASGEQE